MNLVDHEFIKYMSRFDDCPFTLVLHGERHQIGEGEPAFSVVFRQIPKVKELMTSTSLALGEAYMDGDIQVEGELYPALRHFMGQMGKFSTDTKALGKLMFSSVSKRNQKKEVCSHYDIGNDFYRLWLDETLSYSCGYFKREEDTLYEAQCNKADRILKKLYLKEGMTVCDIGCGWGFLLLRAAKKYKVRGVGITLSREQ
ncbi:MAG TPA: SAM-dependent methyltransferase, partial [Lachnospiraceae bacterium]|nr:SAM-dependent methyltransferase [Lachnospiraceae bacterium]